jgi:hypothetical protein
VSVETVAEASDPVILSPVVISAFEKPTETLATPIPVVAVDTAAMLIG